MRFRALTSASLAIAMLTLAACGDKAPAPAPQAQPAPVAASAEPAAPAPAAAPIPADPAARVAQVIDQRYPGVVVGEVKQVEGPNPPLFRAVVSGKIAYTNEAADFFLVGGELLVGEGNRLVNTTKRDALVEGSKIYNDLPFDKALKRVYGTGERQVVVFSDPDCPFCQQLEVMFKAAESNPSDQLNATVYTLPYVLDGLHPTADAKARQILCTADPTKSWEDWMLTAAQAKNEAEVQAAWTAWSKRNPAPTNCPRAADVDAIKKVGYDLGFNQTPTLMFSNGMPWQGLLTRNELEQSWNYVKDNPQPPAATPTPAPTP